MMGILTGKCSKGRNMRSFRCVDCLRHGNDVLDTRVSIYELSIDVHFWQDARNIAAPLFPLSSTDEESTQETKTHLTNSNEFVKLSEKKMGVKEAFAREFDCKKTKKTQRVLRRSMQQDLKSSIYDIFFSLFVFASQWDQKDHYQHQWCCFITVLLMLFSLQPLCAVQPVSNWTQKLRLWSIKASNWVASPARWGGRSGPRLLSAGISEQQMKKSSHVWVSAEIITSAWTSTSETFMYENANIFIISCLTSE